MQFSTQKRLNFTWQASKEVNGDGLGLSDNIEKIDRDRIDYAKNEFIFCHNINLTQEVLNSFC